MHLALARSTHPIDTQIAAARAFLPLKRECDERRLPAQAQGRTQIQLPVFILRLFCVLFLHFLLSVGGVLLLAPDRARANGRYLRPLRAASGLRPAAVAWVKSGRVGGRRPLVHTLACASPPHPPTRGLATLGSAAGGGCCRGEG